MKWEVDHKTGCWIWSGPLDKYGYGRDQPGYRAGRSSCAHRNVYEDILGIRIGEGMTIDHLCFNPPCVNPEHLRELTHLENARNQRSARKTHCIHGHEFTPENTYRYPNGRRSCRTCTANQQRAYQIRKALGVA